LRNDLNREMWDSKYNEQLASQSRVDVVKGDSLETSSIRVLVVEDSEEFRKFICSTLGEEPELQIVGEDSDGLQAVQRVGQLQPDLILLDIGLPSMNGIAAARRIRELSPKSKILFVSQESSVDFVQEALALGALGYVVKSDAGKELLTAVEAVIQGRQYLSSGLLSHNLADATDTQAIRSLTQAGSPVAGIEKWGIPRSHEVEFYSDDVAFVIGFSRFVEAALEAGNAVIVIATESHRKSLLRRLQEHGVDVAAAIERKRYISLDVPDMFSPVRFANVVGDLIVEAAKAAGGEHLRVAVG
jgi:DNA-binding NarL/FixJ family response regulator